MLKLENLVKIFNKDTVDESVLFEDFNLFVPKGQFVSVVGSNGSGKTTMLNLISGTMGIEGGRILLDDTDITVQKEFVRARRIGRVYQNPSMSTASQMTISENMAIAVNKNKPFNLSQGLKKSQIAEFRDLVSTLDLGLENKMDTLVGSLSGGQRQALTLLMATMTPIDLLLLDEHTAALDPRTSEKIMELTKSIVERTKITTLMVTHNLRFAVDYGNRILMMDKGKAVLDKAGSDKNAVKVQDLLEIFNTISIECGN